MGKTVALLHSTKVIMEPIEKLFAEIAPEVRVFHLLDEGLLKIGYYEEAPRKKIYKRTFNLIISAEEAGADVIVVTSSVVWPVVDMALKLISVPVVQINKPLMEAAVERGKTIGIVATDPHSIPASKSLAEEVAKKKGKDVTVRTVLCEEAFEARLAGDIAKHNQLLLQTLEDFSREVDVIALAQASMATVAEEAQGRVRIPVLSSPKLAVEKVKEILRTGE